MEAVDWMQFASDCSKKVSLMERLLFCNSFLAPVKLPHVIRRMIPGIFSVSFLQQAGFVQ